MNAAGPADLTIPCASSFVSSRSARAPCGQVSRGESTAANSLHMTGLRSYIAQPDGVEKQHLSSGIPAFCFISVLRCFLGNARNSASVNGTGPQQSEQVRWQLLTHGIVSILKAFVLLICPVVKESFTTGIAA
jgi:hypothetical protein